MSSIRDAIKGGDLDRHDAAREDDFDGRSLGLAQARAPCTSGGKDKFRGRPIHRGRLIHRAVAARLPRQLVNEVGFAPVTVATGFGRYIPFTAIAAVTSGMWTFIPVFGGLRTAMPTSVARAMAAAGYDPSRSALEVARNPANYGYVLHMDTYVPVTLSPGDRQILASAT